MNAVPSYSTGRTVKQCIFIQNIQKHKGFPNSKRSRVESLGWKPRVESPLPYTLVHGYVEKILASFLLMQKLWAPRSARSACSSCGLFQDNSLGPLLGATWKHIECWRSHTGVSSLPPDIFSPALPYSACMVLPSTLIQQFWEHCVPYMCWTAVILIRSKTDASRSINQPTWWSGKSYTMPPFPYTERMQITHQIKILGSVNQS